MIFDYSYWGIKHIAVKKGKNDIEVYKGYIKFRAKRLWDPILRIHWGTDVSTNESYHRFLLMFKAMYSGKYKIILYQEKLLDINDREFMSQTTIYIPKGSRLGYERKLAFLEKVYILISLTNLNAQGIILSANVNVHKKESVTQPITRIYGVT